jgi:hypothetical protein
MKISSNFFKNQRGFFASRSTNHRKPTDFGSFEQGVLSERRTIMRYSDDTRMTCDKARSLVDLYMPDDPGRSVGHTP